MEGSEAIFESLNLTPQLFINEVLNLVDDLLDEAFKFFLQEASARLKTDGTDRSAELTKGVSYIRDLIQLTLDRRMQKWEEYSLRFCFSVPEGFLLPKANGPHGDDSVDLDALTDTELDVQLNSLRNRLSSVGKETAKLARELHALERQSLSSNQSARSIDEALELYKEHGATHAFQELTNMSSEFRTKLGNLKRKRMEEAQRDRANSLNTKHNDVLGIPHGNGELGRGMCLHKRLFTAMAMAYMKKNPSSAIQALYDLCAETFTPSAASPPSPTAVHKLSSLLDTIGPADVGLSDDSKEDDRGHGPLGIFSFNRVDRWAQPLTYVDIHEGKNFTMCIFRFPTSSVIPLHDHPGMTVLSKVLYGSLHVKAYDWIEPARIRKIQGKEHSTVRLAKLVVDKVLTAPITSILYPKSGGNLHCFTAITPCAVLDILAPPYDEYSGRGCSYYRDFSCSSFSTEDDKSGIGEEEEYAWLEEIDTPDDLCMRSGTYTGPPIEK